MWKRVSLGGLLVAILLMLLAGLWTGTAQEGDSLALTETAFPTCDLGLNGLVNISAGPCSVPPGYDYFWPYPDMTAEVTGTPELLDGWLYRVDTP